MKVRCAASADAAIARAADSALTRIYEQWRTSLAVHLVLPGGRSGVNLATTISAGLKKARPRVLHLWFADERFVEYSDPYRNDTPIIAAFESVGCTLIVHRYGTPSQLNQLAAAERYGAELRATLGDEPFTTVLLSMGEDGHIASIFPKRAYIADDVFAVTDAPKSPPLRISLSLNRLAKTYECLLLALGGSKMDAIQALLRKDPSLPATLLGRQTPLTLITDQRLGDYADAI